MHSDINGVTSEHMVMVSSLVCVNQRVFPYCSTHPGVRVSTRSLTHRHSGRLGCCGCFAVSLLLCPRSDGVSSGHPLACGVRHSASHSEGIQGGHAVP